MRCRWSSSTGSCCTWSQSCLRPGQRGSTRPRINVNPAECQGQAEAEIATYRRLSEDWEDFSLTDALDNSDSLQTIHKTTTHKFVDGKVVSKTKDTKILRR
ncbi:Keratin, type I cytoskeletal 18 [Vulpes lagopus]